MLQSIQKLFDHYENLTNAALSGNLDMAALSNLYDEAFIGSSPTGVIAGKKDDDFKHALETGIAHYREIGAREMTIQNLRPEQLDAIRALVRVDWRQPITSPIPRNL